MTQFADLDLPPDVIAPEERSTADCPSLCVFGTGSDAGKSTIAAGLCRVLANGGARPAPFKAQNMSNNSTPALITPDDDGGGAAPEAWGEIGTAQAVQAQACRLAPRVEMNPLLLKSGGRREADGAFLCSAVVLGRAVFTETFGELAARTSALRALVARAHARLSLIHI